MQRLREHLMKQKPRAMFRFRFFTKISLLGRDVKTGQANPSWRKFEFYSDVETEKSGIYFFLSLLWTIIGRWGHQHQGDVVDGSTDNLNESDSDGSVSV